MLALTLGYRQVTLSTTNNRIAHAQRTRTFILLVLVDEFWRYSKLREQELKAQLSKMFRTIETLFGLIDLFVF